MVKERKDEEGGDKVMPVRAMGEKGIVTDKDVKRFKRGRKKISTSLARIFGEKGRITDLDISRFKGVKRKDAARSSLGRAVGRLTDADIKRMRR